MRMSQDEALIFTSGQPAIRATKLRYFREPLFIERAQTPPPGESDRIIRRQPVAVAAPTAAGASEIVVGAPPCASPQPAETDETADPANGDKAPETAKALEQRVVFLKTNCPARSRSKSDKGKPSKPPQRLM